MDRSIPILFFFFLFLASPGVAQQEVQFDEDAEEMFFKGMERFAASDFEDAYAEFRKVFSAHPTNQRTTAAYVMGTKALFYLGRYDESAELSRRFLRRFMKSRYRSDAHFTLGANYLVTRRYEDALEEFLIVLEFSEREALKEKAESLAEKVVDDNFERREVESLFKRTITPRAKSFLGVKLAEKRISEGHPEEAQIILNSILREYPNIVYAGRAKDLLRKLDTKTPIRIGVLLPLFRESSDATVKAIGKELLQGVEFAVEESASGSKGAVELRVMDSEGDPQTAAILTRTLSRDKEVIAMVGPIYSAEVRLAGPVANEEGLPLVTPTATAIGLTSLGPSVFQANPDYALRGKAMARFAVQRLGLRTIAVLAPSDSYGRFMAESFVEEVEHLGGRIFGTEWYQRGATEYQEQLMRLRQSARVETAEFVISFARKISPGELSALRAQGVSQRILDSLIAQKGKMGVTTLLGKDGKRIADSLQILTVKDVPTEDDMETPVTLIDAFYLPIARSEEIGIVSAQLAYHNFKTQLLGTGEWYNPVELDANARYTEGIIFDSDTYVEATDSTYLRFFDEFYHRKNSRPTKNTLFGYDSARLILSLIAEGARTRGEVASGLRRINEFQGLHSKISFNPVRVNSVLNILRYARGEVRKIDEITVMEAE